MLFKHKTMVRQSLRISWTSSIPCKQMAQLNCARDVTTHLTRVIYNVSCIRLKWSATSTSKALIKLVAWGVFHTRRTRYAGWIQESVRINHPTRNITKTKGLYAGSVVFNCIQLFHTARRSRRRNVHNLCFTWMKIACS